MRIACFGYKCKYNSEIFLLLSYLFTLVLVGLRLFFPFANYSGKIKHTKQINVFKNDIKINQIDILSPK